MTDSQKATVQVTHAFRASAERVFDAWLDPAKAGRFLFATETGAMVRVEIDPRVGGAFLFTDRRDGVDVDHVGEYVAIERPRRLVFDFAVPLYSPERTRVTVEIAPVGDGCALTLTHAGVLGDYREKTEDGWSTILATLERQLG